MKLSFLQLNIQQNNHLPAISSYLQNNAFDIIHMQEVTAYAFQTFLSQGFKGEIAYLYDIEVKTTFAWGNATFYKPSLQLTHKQTIQLRSPHEPMPENEGLEELPDITKNVLVSQFSLPHMVFTTLNTHLAWGPNPLDRPYKVTQGLRLVDVVKRLNTPFLLSGDFNVTPESQIVKSLNELGVNHTVKSGATNTLNPRLHRIKHLFPPGYAVDYLYTSPNLKTENFKILEDDLSDHYALRIECEL